MKKIMLAISLLLFIGCSSPYKDKLKISANAWIGYSPLFYAYDKGWLDTYNIEVKPVVSLAESMFIYTSENVNAFVGTQYEYNSVKEKVPTLTPVVMFDKSNGGDMVLSNRTIEALQKSTKNIEVYLEMDSINSVLLKQFIKYNHIDANKLHYINEDQERISLLQASKKPTIVVTYSPYDNLLKKHGYTLVASTKDGIVDVVDALYCDKETLQKHTKQLQKVQEMKLKALKVLKENPKEYYNHVKYYLQNISYQEFLDSLKGIEFIYKDIDPQLKKNLEKEHFALDKVIQ